MQLIRSTPQVLGCRFDGVYNDKGILRFESQEAFMDIMHKLNDLQDLYDDASNVNEASPWAIIEPIFFEFEQKLGFESLRRILTNGSRYQTQDSKNGLSPTDKAHFISDDLLQTVLNSKLEINIGNINYRILNENKVSEVCYSGKEREERILNTGNDLEITSTKASICSQDNGNQGDITKFSPNNSATPLEYWFDTYVIRDQYYSNIQSLTWEIYDSAGATIHSFTPTSYASGRLIYTFPRAGNYLICVRMAGLDYTGSIFSIRCCREYEITAYREPNCCNTQNRQELAPRYAMHSRILYGHLRSYNAGFYFAVNAASIHSSNNGGEKADRLQVKLEGTWFNRQCTSPNSFRKGKSKKNRKRLTVRVLSIGKRLRGDNALYLTKSFHAAEDRNDKKEFYLRIPVCS